jgi:phosphatidylinositol kinase/protein kinase (PI-3  family)
VLHNQLSLVLRDDLLSWYASRNGSSNTSEKQQQQQQVLSLPFHSPHFANEALRIHKVEKQLRGCVDTNVQRVLQRIGKMAPTKAPPAQEQHTGPITPPNKQVFALIQAATSTDNLSQMSPTWMPWL